VSGATGSDGFRVDIAALEQTVTRLHAVAAGLAPAADRAAYDTTIGGGALGTGFAGATGLLGAHDAMQSWIAEMIGQLRSVIEEYGDRTAQAATGYRALETRTTRDLYSSS